MLLLLLLLSLLLTKQRVIIIYGEIAAGREFAEFSFLSAITPRRMRVNVTTNKITQKFALLSRLSQIQWAVEQLVAGQDRYDDVIQVRHHQTLLQQ